MRTRAHRGVCFAFALLLGCASSARASEDVHFVRIGTGPIGGSYFLVGGLIANVISNPPGAMACDLGGSCGVPGVVATAVSTQGSVSNIRALSDRSVELALCQADLANDAARGLHAFKGEAAMQLRAVANLYQEAVHVVAARNAHFTTVAALKGKRVAIGEDDSGTQLTARAVLRAYDLSSRALHALPLKLSQSTDLLMTGELDAFFMVGGPPVPAVALAAGRTAIMLVPIEGRPAHTLVKQQPFFSMMTIPADTYPGVGATPTIAVGAQLLTVASADPELIYAITRALWDPRNRKVFLAGNASSRSMALAHATSALAVPLHEGAERFYREVGMTNETKTEPR